MTGVFIDTNIAVYAYDRADPAKRAIAQRILSSRPRPHVSPQVLREFYAVMVGRLGMPESDASAAVVALAPAARLVEDSALILAAIATSTRWGVRIWDALIVEAARRVGCDELVSEDLQDGMDFDGVRVRNPFL
jgi:predicted nucleic acid-binding protein